MKLEGPSLEALIRRLEECPPDFLAEPMPDVAAVVSDLLVDLGGSALDAKSASGFVMGPKKYETVAGGRVSELGLENRLRLILVAAWLLHDGWFLSRGGLAPAAREFFADGLDALARDVEARRFIVEPERREELARLCLKALGMRPAGETLAQAQDRLTTVDSIETRRVVEEVRRREQRAEEVRAAMRRKAAEAAAAKVSRE